MDIQKILKTTPSLKKIYADINEELVSVEDYLRTFSKSDNRLISEINSYIFDKKGKRIRPALLLLCSKLRGYEGDEHILLCTLVEAIHTASLIHDDIIDNSNLRRGKETVHARWGPNITVLLGDYLYIKSLGMSLQSSVPDVFRILTETSSQMIEGELYEYTMSGNLEIKEDQYLNIIHKKTAVLFAASCRLGGILGKGNASEIDALEEYGTHIGMSFQIIDDLLDYTGEEESMGKPVLSDLTEGRITLPLIHTLNNNSSHRREIIRLINNKDKENDYRRQIISLIESNGALEYSFQKAQEFSEKAKQILKVFPDNPIQNALSHLADYILVRNK